MSETDEAAHPRPMGLPIADMLELGLEALLAMARRDAMVMDDDMRSPEGASIDVDNPRQLRAWSVRFAVSDTDVRAAVRKVGPNVKNVARELGKAL